MDEEEQDAMPEEKSFCSMPKSCPITQVCLVGFAKNCHSRDIKIDSKAFSWKNIMSCLIRLPTEVISMILTALGDVDLKTLIVAQSVCTLFRDLIDTIAFVKRHSRPTESGKLEFDPFLCAEFSSLLCALSPADRTRSSTLVNMFRDLPWAQTESSREPYLRPGASWRRLCLTMGGPPITRLDCTTLKTYHGRGTTTYGVSYSEVNMLSPWLTMGCLYDALVLGDRARFCALEKRKLLLGYRVANYSYAEYLCRTPQFHVENKPEFVAMYANDAASKQTAVLLLDQSDFECNDRFPSPRFEDLRNPRAQGDDFLGFIPCEWQGPLPNPEGLRHFDFEAFLHEGDE